MSDDFNKPNVVIPLAMSYDTRKILSQTEMLAGVDQRKINMFYEIIKNPGTGNVTLELVKRPGVATRTTSAFSGVVNYLIKNVSGALLSPWVISWNSVSGVATAADASVTATIYTDTAYSPAYLDSTIISGTVTAVMQARTTSATAQKVYYATAANSWTQISDADFTGLTVRGKIEHMDGYAFALDSNNRINNSDLNSIANWTAGQYVTKQIQSDRALGLAKYKNLILAFGFETCEVLRNVGNPSGSPLSTVPGMAVKIGLGAAADPNVIAHGYSDYYTILGERMYLLGKEFGTPYTVGLFMFDGQTFTKVSTGTIDRILQDASSAVPLCVQRVGHYGKNAVAIQLTLPQTSSQRWLMYYPDINEWFEWSSDYFTPRNDGENFLIPSGNVQVAFGQSSTGWIDGATAYTGSVQFRVPDAGNNRKFMRWCGLDADTTTSASNVTVKFSDDDYQNFDSGRTIDLNTSKKSLYRCGSYRTRVVRLEHSANAEFRARKFLARIE